MEYLAGGDVDEHADGRGAAPRIAVVGGSIAGCAAAIAAARAGCHVDVYERSVGALAERGYGIAIPKTLRSALVDNGYLPAEMPVIEAEERYWITRDPSRPDEQRILARNAAPAVACNWGLLWRALRSRVPDAAYHAGEQAEYDGEALHVTIDGAQCTASPFDLLIGADGTNSSLRALVSAERTPEYAGYAVWRGKFAADTLDGPLEILERNVGTVMFDGGQFLAYPIPEESGRRVITWVYYARPGAVVPEQSNRSFAARDMAGLVDLVKKLAERHLPPAWAHIVTQTPDEDIAVHPVVDLEVERYTRGPLLLAGDAGAITRPHTASGAVKSLGDALCLERVLASEPTLDAAVARYDRERTLEGNRVSALGRRIGRAQVEQVPDFSRLSDDEARDWVKAPLEGDSSYIFGAIIRTE